MLSRTMRVGLTIALAGLCVVFASAAQQNVANADNSQSKVPQTNPSTVTPAATNSQLKVSKAVPQTAARADAGQSKAPQAAADSAPVWVRTGGPIGGIGYDIRSRPDNPDYMFVTDINSGLNISVDGGRTWTPSNTGFDVNGVFAATIDPNNNNVVWAGTQNWMGIFKSTDGGRTWVRKSNGVTTGFGTSFRGFTVDPTNSDIVYAAGELSPLVWNNGVPLTYNGADLAKGMVYKTTDGGEHWTQIWAGENLARYVWIDPRNTKILYVSTGIFDRMAANSNAATNDFGGVGILKSTDGGETWRVLNKANGLVNLYVSSLFMHPTNPDILVAGTGGGDGIGSGVYLTNNGGETWTRTLEDPISPSMASTMPFTVVEISPVSPQVVYAATARCFFRSDDGARTWNRYVYPGSDQLPFWGPPGAKSGTPVDLEADRRDPMRVYANLYLGGNLLSTDGGMTWANASRGYTGAMINSMAVDPGDPAIVYAVAAGGVFKSTNGGSDWQGLNDVASNFPSGMAAVAVSPSNGRDVLVSDAGTGSIWKSVEGGRGWIRVLNYSNTLTPGGVPSPNPSAVLQGFVSIAYAPSDARVVYAGLAMAQCWPFVAPSQICDYPTLKTLHRSTDGGTTWEVTAGEGLGLRSFLALAVHPRNPDIVYAGTGAPGLFKTENGGRTWVSITNGISSLAIRSIAIDPSSPQTVFVGTAGAAVFKSVDGGASWISSSAGLPPDAFIKALMFDPMNPSTIWAGAYRSVDAGGTWVKVSAGIVGPDMRVANPETMAISDDGGTVYGSSWGDGVYRLDLPVAPKVRSQPSSAGVAVGGAASFTARASGTAAPTVQWQLSADGGSTWNDVSGATSPTYAFTVALADQGRRYRAVFTNSLGSATSSAAALTVYVAPDVTTAPTSVTVTSGATASFTTAASGIPAPTVQWQVSANSGATWSDISGATNPTYSMTAAVADHGKRFRALFTNVVTSTASSAATLGVYGPASASPSPVRVGAVKAAGSIALSSQTAAQTVTVAFAGAPSAWTATTTQTWLSITGGSGVGPGQFTVALANPNDVIGASTSLAGTVSITSATAANAPLSIPVTLTVTPPGASGAPFGAFDTPADQATGLQGSFAVTGWALDDVGIDRVEIWRDLVVGEDPTHAYTSDPAYPATGKVFIAKPYFVSGSRTDVEALNPAVPVANRAGWGYLLLSWGLQGQGNGPYTLYAYAFDVDGHSALLGSKTIAVDNAHATKPFGAIDTPSYGGTMAGAGWNFGWALTPNALAGTEGSAGTAGTVGAAVAAGACTITNGLVTMHIDSGPAHTVNYGDLRTDIAASFSGFSNGNNSGGASYFDTATLTNGTHQIGWLVYDSCGRGDGIGSRFFTVLNAGAGDAVPAGDTPGLPPLLPSAASADGTDSSQTRQTRPTSRSEDARQPGLPVLSVVEGKTRPTSAREAPGISETLGQKTRPTSASQSTVRSDPKGVASRIDVGRGLSPGDQVQDTNTSRVSGAVSVRHVGGGWQNVARSSDGTHVVEVSQDGRIEVQLPPTSDRYTGEQIVARGRSALPLGSSLDAKAGVFYWQPAAGFLGKYDLAFESPDADPVRVRVVVGPPMRAVIDTPRSGEILDQTFALAGWAIDLAATKGTGVDTVHVWAYPVGAADPTLRESQGRPEPGQRPIFLGVAASSDRRPDVGAMFGETFEGSAYSLTVDSLSPGTYDIVIYPHRAKTNTFEGAQIVRVVVR